MARRRERTVEDRERDARAVELRRRHLNYQQIAREMGYASKSSAYEAVQRGLNDTQAESNDEVRQMELERLDDLARVAQRAMNARHYVVSAGGKIVYHPDTGEPLIDHGPNLQALDKLIKIMERRAKYLPLDAPTRVEVFTLDAIEAEIRRLEAELGCQPPRSQNASMND